MQFDITVPITVYDFSNPPASNNGSDIKLNLINSDGFFKFIPEEVGIHSRYMFTIKNAKDAGFTSTEQYFLDAEIKNIILAINLVLPWAALTIIKSEFVEPKIQFKPDESTITRSDGTKPNNSVIHIFNAGLRTTVRISTGGSENVDEKISLDLFKKIQAIKKPRMESTLPLATINLVKAFNEYENSTISFERLSMFKHLFNAIELSINWNGRNLIGNDFDSAVAAMAHVDQNDVREWREFYNRAKHVDTTPNHVDATVRGMEKLPSILLPVRSCASKIIFQILNKN